MYCPNCRSEYRSGFTHCPDCDLDLVAELPPESELQQIQESDLDDELVVVYTTNRLEAEMIRSLLEGNGIHAINARGESSAYAVNVGAMGEGRVLVQRTDEHAARELIAAATSGELALEDERD